MDNHSIASAKELTEELMNMDKYQKLITLQKKNFLDNNVDHLAELIDMIDSLTKLYPLSRTF